MRADVRTFLHGFEVPVPVLCDVLVALQEACKNAVRFGGTHGPIEVSVAVGRDDVMLVVHDHGGGFEPPPLPPARPDPLTPRGRGLYLMAALMDDLQIRRDHGTVVCMRRRLWG